MPIPAEKTKISRLTAKEHVYMRLKDWIIEGTLRPGEKISDAEIASFFSVSRTPVREAMQMLSASKLIEIIPGKESRVTKIDKKEASEAYEMLGVLHCAALQKAVTRLTPERITELKRINDEFLKAYEEKEPTRLRELDGRFHEVFLELADNRFLTDEAELLLPHVLRVENLHYKYFADRVESANEHAEIIKALERGDVAGAREWMRRNWEHFAVDVDML